MKDQNCIFCKIANGDIPSATLYEDNDFRVILDLGPAAKGHALILPKEHFANLYELPDEIAAKALVLAKKMASKLTEILKCDGFNVVQNNGVCAGQTVFHFHIHLIPRYENDHVGLGWTPGKLTEEDKAEILAVSAKKTAEKQRRFIESYHKYSALVMKVAFDMTSDFDLSEEICQNVFLSYFVNMSKILPKCDKTWLVLTTKNLTIDYFRKASTKYEALHEDPLQEKYSVNDAYDTVREMMKQVAQKELSGEILRDLKRRNRSWYRIMYGVYIEGHSVEDVAKSMGISTSRLYSKIYRAKNYIKDRYGDQYTEYFKYFETP